jgi:hypothetical protein
LRNLQTYAPGIDAEWFPDSAYIFDADVALETSSVRAVRDRIGPTRYFCLDPGAMPMDHRGHGRSALYDLVRRLKEATQTQAVLVSSSPADHYIEKIAGETGSPYVDTIFDYREYMALAKDAEFVVTGRYHNPILAAIVGTPSITFASANHKVHGACETLEGVVGVPYDGTYLRPDLDAIVQQARSYIDDRDGFRTRLTQVCGRRRDEVIGLGARISDLLDRASASRAASAADG